MIIQLPVETEVLEKVGDLKPRGKAENNQIIIEFDTRRREYQVFESAWRIAKFAKCRGLSREFLKNPSNSSAFPCCTSRLRLPRIAATMALASGR